MCSNRKTLACIFDNQNHSIVSEAYKKKTDKRSTSNQFTQIQIKFKNKFRLLTAIDEKTTFDDLKLALVISYYKKRLSKSVQNKDDQTKKFAKNYENLKKIATDDYVICETVNEVDRVIDSSVKVRNTLKQIKNESIFLKDMKVTHSMRLKRSLTRHEESPKSTEPKEKQFPILNEFFIDTNKSKECISPTYENVQPHDIDVQLKCFDNLIQQRKNYIKLLEEYLELSDQLEAELTAPAKVNHLRTATSNETELDSSDTGFSSPDDISCVDSLSDRFNEWCVGKAIPEEQKVYYKKISNFETYV